jgi:hypothetical protein
MVWELNVKVGEFINEGEILGYQIKQEEYFETPVYFIYADNSLNFQYILKDFVKYEEFDVETIFQTHIDYMNGNNESLERLNTYDNLYLELILLDSEEDLEVISRYRNILKGDDSFSDEEWFNALKLETLSDINPFEQKRIMLEVNEILGSDYSLINIEIKHPKYNDFKFEKENEVYKSDVLSDREYYIVTVKTKSVEESYVYDKVFKEFIGQVLD